VFLAVCIGTPCGAEAIDNAKKRQPEKKATVVVMLASINGGK
jgi:hypothetical protein